MVPWTERPAFYGSKAKPRTPADVVSELETLVRSARSSISARCSGIAPLIFIRTAGRATNGKLTTPALLERLLSPAWLRRCFIVCSHLDPEYVDGSYERALADSPFADRILVGADGANYVSFS